MTSFTLSDAFLPDVPEPAPKWTGGPRLPFGAGNNDLEAVPVEALAEAAARVIRREGAGLAVYNLGGDPLGYRPLRDFITAHLGRRGITAGPENVLITAGSGNGIDLVIKGFLQPGDTVLIEEHSYAGAIRRFTRNGVRLVGVPLDADGIVPEALAGVLDRLAAEGVRPKMLYTIPTVQNPTATVLPPDRREAIARIARERGFVIFEDECYADLTWTGTAPAAIHGLAPDISIHIGSFSKTLGPAVRVGYLVAGEEAVRRLLALRADGGVGAIDQMVVAEYFTAHFDAHLTALRARLSHKLDVLIEEIRRNFGVNTEITRPEGGIFLWVALPPGTDSLALARRAQAEGIAINPGPEWSTSAATTGNWIRLCYAQTTEAQIREGIRRLAEIARDIAA